MVKNKQTIMASNKLFTWLYPYAIYYKHDIKLNNGEFVDLMDDADEDMLNTLHPRDKAIYIDAAGTDQIALYKLHHMLQYDDETAMYVTYGSISMLMANIISRKMEECSCKTIIDATASIGGNTVAFQQHHMIHKVVAVEIDKERASMLRHNVRLFNNHDNVTIHNGDVTKMIHALGTDNAVFVDPPWGGKSYQDIKVIHDLQLGADKSFNSWLITMIRRHNVVACKLPINYNRTILINIANILKCKVDIYDPVHGDNDDGQFMEPIHSKILFVVYYKHAF